MVAATCSGVSMSVLATSMAPTRSSLSLSRHLGVGAFERDLVDAAGVERGEDRLVLAPFGAQRLLPVDVGLDAVAVADVHRGLDAQAVDRDVQRVDAPVANVVHEHVEGGFVELDDVDAGGLELLCLVIEDLREGHRHVGAAAVVAVGDGVADRHRAGQRELESVVGVGAGEGGLVLVHRALARHGGGDGGHVDNVAVVADAHPGLLLPVDAVDVFEEAVHEVAAELLALADDVDAAVFLFLDPQQRGVALALVELGTVEAPRRPQLFRFGEPRRFRQTAGDGGVEHERPPRARSGLGWPAASQGA
jgi:hypothetical protein